MGGDHRLVEKMVTAFKQDLEKNLAYMQTYYKSGEKELLANTAHILKTQSAYMGLDEMTELCRRIEMSSKEGIDNSEIEGMIQGLKDLSSKLLKDESSSN